MFPFFSVEVSTMLSVLFPGLILPDFPFADEESDLNPFAETYIPYRPLNPFAKTYIPRKSLNPAAEPYIPTIPLIIRF